MSREEALNLIKENVRNDKLVKHMLAVEAIMRKLAKRLGKDETLWSLTGLLHDLDYDIVKGDMEIHGIKAAEMLEGKLPKEALDAIKAHNDLTGFKCDSDLAKALKAADQLSGLIVATALVMPHKKIEEIKLSTLRRKFKQKDFARGVDRNKIKLCEELGLSLEEFLELGLEALKEIHDKLGL
ncbi:MAG: phosphohydrolase [Thermoprotei archaeon]|nr:MAG: phosphohydrolase [Thermoprotei archaeon]RLF20002.1 MAG: phosphohydrolase [Thermoprotei archaeon]